MLLIPYPKIFHILELCILIILQNYPIFCDTAQSNSTVIRKPFIPPVTLESPISISNSSPTSSSVSPSSPIPSLSASLSSEKSRRRSVSDRSFDGRSLPHPLSYPAISLQNNDLAGGTPLNINSSLIEGKVIIIITVRFYILLLRPAIINLSIILEEIR